MLFFQQSLIAPDSPTLIPVRITAQPASFSDFFDLPRFYHDSGIIAVDFSAVKPITTPGTLREVTERVSCWSIHEKCTGHGNKETQA